MGWRDPSPLFPEVEQQAEGCSPLSYSQPAAGPRVPADAHCAPDCASATPFDDLAGASAHLCAPADALARTCAAYRCTQPVASRLTGMCELHSERHLADLRAYTDSIGRGELEA